MVILLAAICGVVVSCSDPKTTAYVKNEHTIESDVPGLDGTLYSAALIMYQDNQELGTIALGDVSTGGGVSDVVELNANCNKVRVKFYYLPLTSSQLNPAMYTSLAIPVTAEIENEILVDNNTTIGSSF
ncbi:MAG: hypothetical protein H6Q25_733 [Bacteroidetes bacterium]|nr:hypothetical protein [Bacteroidota bacterium]